MTTMGWVFMLGSVTAVLSTAIWCYRRVLSLPRERGKQEEDPESASGTGGAPS